MSKSFDDILKEKLNNYQIEPKGAAWEDFKERLDSELNKSYEKTNDSNLDHHVKTKLKDFTVSYKASHWAVLKARLQKNAKNLENLYVSKAFELTTILLILLTFAQNGFYIPNKDIASSNVIIAENSFSKASNNIEVSQSGIDQVIDITKLNNHTNNTVNSNQKSIITTSSIKYIADEADLKLVSDKKVPISGKLNNKRVFLEIDNQITNIAPSNPQIELSIDRLPSISLGNQIQRDYTFPSVIVENSSFNSSKIGRNKIEFFATADNNLIQTPADQIYSNVEEVLFNAINYGFGLNYSKNINNTLDFDIGIGYQGISYTPQEINEIFIDQNSGGTYSISLSKIIFNIIDIPVKIKSHLVRNDSWALFTELGIAGNFIAKSNYQTTSQALRITSPAYPPAEFNPGEKDEHGPKLFEKDFNDGLFEGGSLDENLYLTANIGLGISKEINERFGVFSSINYKSHLYGEGIGPNLDKVNSVSFKVGAHYNLN